MIKPGELRAGNIVSLKNGDIIEVSAEMLTPLHLKEEYSGMLEPLPLTTEWLLKLGFSKDEENDFFLQAGGSFRLRQATLGFELYMNGVLLASGPLSVHRFQNLVYELTDTEIKIIEEKDELGEAVRLAADSILYQYIPQDRASAEFNFALSIEGENYTVHYRKDQAGYWEFAGYAKDT